MKAQAIMRIEATATPRAACTPASKPVANIAGRYIANRRSEDAHPPTKRNSVAIATLAAAMPESGGGIGSNAFADTSDPVEEVGFSFRGDRRRLDGRNRGDRLFSVLVERNKTP